MSVYQEYPDLAALPISTRTHYFKRVALDNLSSGKLTVEQLLQATDEAIAAEQYELAAGIAAALDGFQAVPQLALF